MEFNYLYTTMATGQINIEDIGNCIIQANDDKSNYKYLWIKTRQGFSQILEFGPINKYLIDKYNVSYTRIEFDYKKITKTIDMFLNSGKLIPTQIILIEEQELEKNFLNILEIMKQN